MRMLPLLFLVLLFAEVWSIIQVGHQCGALATLVLLFAGFIFGMQLIRSQGIGALMKTAQQMNSGQSPLEPLAAAVINVFAGILLVFPGFVSDAIALCLLLPFVRKAIIKRLLTKGQFQGFAAGNFGGAMSGNPFARGGFGAANDDAHQGNIYEHEPVVKTSTDDEKVIEHKPDQK